MTTESPIPPEVEIPPVNDPLTVAIVSALRALQRESEAEAGQRASSGAAIEAEAA